MNATYKVSKEGLAHLEEELRELRENKRPNAVERVKKARAMGDLSENSEYSSAREDLNMIDNKILEIEEKLRNIEVVEESSDNGIVQLGDKVKVRVKDGHETFCIVGELEADITKGKISDTSPIGKALLGKPTGYVATVQVPAGEVEYEIVSISK